MDTALSLPKEAASSDENFFGRIDNDLVTKLLENKVTPETLESYLRDGERANEQDPPATPLDQNRIPEEFRNRC